MKEWLKSLPRTIADQAVTKVVGILLVLGAAAFIGNAGEIVRSNSSQGNAETRASLADGWPDGESAWTVILASEQTQGAAEAAVDRARRVPDRGLGLGVLSSNEYRSLRNGYWVAFAGQFASVEEAQAAANRYRSEFPTAYQRFIEE